jgi:Protein of unknown function (DUF664)
MTDGDTPWEPPLAGTEVEHLVGALDRLRTTFRWKADDLDAAGLQSRIGASSLSLGALLKHLALIEDLYFHTKLSGEPPGVAWDAADWDVDDWEFTSAANDTPEQLYHASLRRLLCDLIEEYGRHTGHADLLREAIDGRVGEDPPPGWAPKDGRRPAVDQDR